jgi:hypothetical protein
MRLALRRNSAEPALAGSLLLRMRSWFAKAQVTARPSAGDGQAAVRERLVASNVTPLRTEAEAARPDAHKGVEREGAVVLRFPIHGEALLVKLADELHRIVGSPSREAFDLTLTGRPHAHLTINSSAFVAFDATTGLYELVVELTEDTRIEVKSRDFDTIVRFVAQYVADQLSSRISGESAT